MVHCNRNWRKAISTQQQQETASRQKRMKQNNKKNGAATIRRENENEKSLIVFTALTWLSEVCVGIERWFPNTNVDIRQCVGCVICGNKRDGERERERSEMVVVIVLHICVCANSSTRFYTGFFSSFLSFSTSSPSPLRPSPRQLPLLWASDRRRHWTNIGRIKGNRLLLPFASERTFEESILIVFFFAIFHSSPHLVQFSQIHKLNQRKHEKEFVPFNFLCVICIERDSQWTQKRK